MKINLFCEELASLVSAGGSSFFEADGKGKTLVNTSKFLVPDLSTLASQLNHILSEN